MILSSWKIHPRRVVAAVSGLVVGALAFAAIPSGWLITSPARAVPTSHAKRAFDRAGVVAAGGGAVSVSGPVVCPAPDTVVLRATVSEPLTGAVAEGTWSKACTGKSQHWHLIAPVTDAGKLAAGCGLGAGLAIVSRGGKPIEAFQWLSSLTLTLAGKASAPKGQAIRC